MMQGRVNQRCEATLAIAVKDNEITQMVDTVIDTGFSGFLTLPSDIISTLGFRWEGRGSAHSTGTTGLKMWAFRTLKNTISNMLSDRFTHSFSLVTPLLAIPPLNSQTFKKSIPYPCRV
jgi:hypothetical protein